MIMIIILMKMNMVKIVMSKTMTTMMTKIILIEIRMQVTPQTQNLEQLNELITSKKEALILQAVNDFAPNQQRVAATRVALQIDLIMRET